MSDNERRPDLAADDRRRMEEVLTHDLRRMDDMQYAISLLENAPDTIKDKNNGRP